MQPGARHLFYLLPVYQLHIFSFFLLFAKTIAQPNLRNIQEFIEKQIGFRDLKTPSCTSPQSQRPVHLHNHTLLYISTLTPSCTSLQAGHP